MTLTLLMNRYLNSQRQEGKSALSLSAYATDLKQFSLYFPKSLNSPISIQSGLASYTSWCLKKHSPNSAARKLTTIRSFLTWIYQKGQTSIDFSTAIKLPQRTSENHLRPLSMRTIKKLRTIATVRERLLFELLLQTGMRLAEAVKIRMRDVNERSERLTLSRRDLRISITPPLHQALEYYLAEYPRGPKSTLFSAARATRPIATRSAAILLANLAKKANVPDVTPRNIRATFVEHQFESGVPLATIQQVVGLKTPAALEHYLRASRTPSSKNTTVKLTSV